MSESNRTPEEREHTRQLWNFTALIFGYNELAKLATTLGERVWCRLMRDHAETEYKRLGGALPNDQESAVNRRARCADARKYWAT